MPDNFLPTIAVGRAEAPLSIDGTRLTSGYLSLNPIGPDTRYRASVEVWPSVEGDGV